MKNTRKSIRIGLAAFFLLAMLIKTSTMEAQKMDWSGDWGGVMEVQNMRLTLIFHLSQQADGSYKATMDSPMQSQYGIAMDGVSIRDSSITMGLKAANAEYVGKMAANGELEGKWKQGGQALELRLKRGFGKLNRPQEPKPPFEYHSEEVVFENKKAGIKLAGTLTYPYHEGATFPVAILISGSGQQDRNSEILGHKSFWVIADYFAKNNIAVLRFDDRGVGKSEGKFATATTADFADDVEAAYEFLSKHEAIDKKHIFLIGHSEGGMIAPMVAARQKKIAGCILLAAPGLPFKDLLLQQNRDIGLKSGTDAALLEKGLAISKEIFEAVAADTENKLTIGTLMKQLKPSLDKLSEADRVALNISNEYLVEQVVAVLSPWMRYAIKFDPKNYLTKLKCPVYAVNGDKDVQVHPDNLQAIENHLKTAKNKGLSKELLPNLNHLFQHCDTGLPQEYSAIEETFAPELLEKMANWINSVAIGW